MNKSIKHIGLGLTSVAVAIASLSGAAAADDTSTSGYLTLSSYGGRSGAVVTVTGGDFHANESVSLHVNRRTRSTPYAVVKTNDAGKFTTKLTINNEEPYDSPSVMISADGGTYHDGTYQDSAVVQYHLESNDRMPTIFLSQSFGLPGSPVVVTGGGYTPHESIRINFANFNSTNVVSDQYGDFSATLPAPKQPGQDIEIRANGGTYNNGVYPETAAATYQLLDHSANAIVSTVKVAVGQTYYFGGITDAHHGIVDLNRLDAKGAVLSTKSIEASYAGTYTFYVTATKAQAGKTLDYSVKAEDSNVVQHFQVTVTN